MLTHLFGVYDIFFHANILLINCLILAESPAFILTPSPVTIAQGNRENATFQCKVRSSPEPSRIVWFHAHGDVDEQIRENPDYHIYNDSIPSFGGEITISEATVIGVNGFDSGEIRCEAQYVAIISNRETVVATQTSSATLAVLSKCLSVHGNFIFHKPSMKGLTNACMNTDSSVHTCCTPVNCRV